MERLWTQGQAWKPRVAKLGGPGLALMLVLLILLIIPMLVLGAVAVIAIACIRGTRGLLTRMRSPNGALDGRRNVRVIVRE